MAAPRTNIPILFAYAAVVFLTALAIATYSALTFRPGGEFGSRTGTFLFIFLIWAVGALSIGALPLALIGVALTALGRLARLPWLIGTIYGLLFVGGTSIGHAPSAASLLAAALASPLALVLSLRTPRVLSPGA
jgi:hypothetical protein